MNPTDAKLFPEVDTPALLLDEDLLRTNIKRMQAVADDAGIALRPHAKAHKSIAVARLQRDAGAVGICCAKLGEAEVMVRGGQDNILVTTPITGVLKIRRLVVLAGQANISVVADDAANLAEIDLAARAAGVVVGIVIEVDVGQGRCGVPPGPRAAELMHDIQRRPGLRIAGVQGYQGRLQCVPGYTAREVAVQAAMAVLQLSIDAIRKAGLALPVITGGGTGSTPIDIGLGVLTELQPGSYVTMDTAYAATEWTPGQLPNPFGQPLLVLASVVSRPSADRVVVDVGWKAISNDAGTPKVAGNADLQFEFAGDEHGIVRSLSGQLALRPGDRICLVPSHCDTTVNLHDAFAVHRNGRLESLWPIDARGKSQ